MKVLIVEDELIAARRLKSMLSELDREIAVVDTIDSVAQFRKVSSNLPEVDLIFLDIELGDGKSLDILSQLRLECPVIFITAYQEYALKAFKLNSVDYLLKPLQREELESAMLKFRKFHLGRQNDFSRQLQMVLHSLQTGEIKASRDRFLARQGTRFISVATDQIAYFYKKEKLQFIKTVQNEDFVIDKSLEDIELEVDEKSFFRANRQFVLRYESIDRVHAWFSGKLRVQVKPIAYEEIIISRLKAADFKRWLGE
ncbi:LytR/AlgR family response regulator transcription factor [Flavihumibacter petaseus]|uniref:Putative two-component response regulator n=1 Tax=Flavihumibacter petaseus NBRC 106054 TaxID=1220578 RepID=A0A0E9N5D5_9BACT|nr:LytTR family DNA-binding domain-containing protein [Flavihumibacter petaseus]GAO44891.1 putative two-component response regulator [Flavihumibacter petaseus NBRC 106054]